MFSNKRWVDVPFCSEDVRAATLSTMVLSDAAPSTTVGPDGTTCLASRSAVDKRGVGGVRLGTTRGTLLRSPRLVGVTLVGRKRTRYRYCVTRSRGRVTAVFGRRGRVELVTTTATGHGDRRVRPGRSARSLRAYPRRQRIARGLFRLTPRGPRIVGVRKGRVRFVAVASQRLLRSQNRRVLRGYLRRAGL